MNITAKYKANVILGKYTFMNVKEAHAYALSVAEDKEDYTKRYLEAAGPQLILWYSSTNVKLYIIYLHKDFYTYGEHIVVMDAVSPLIRYRLDAINNKSWPRSLSYELGIPRTYLKKTQIRFDGLCKIIEACVDYADNNDYAKQLFLQKKLTKYIQAESSTAPMKWHITVPLAPISVSHWEFYNIVKYGL